MQDDHLTWIVPGRRAVVKQTLGYRSLGGKWQACLRHYREKLAGWYGLNNDDWSEGDEAITEWLGGLPAEEGEGTAGGAASRDMCREGGNTFDTGGFWVRLWKGPLRVLLNRPATAEERCGDLLISVVEYCGERHVIRQVRNTRAVVNPEAKFLMGDVVEFPLFRFLSICGKEDYEGIAFNGDGSYLCGTSLCTVQGTERRLRPVDAEPRVHENLIAMRFQFLIHLMIGAFYSRQLTYRAGCERIPHAQEPAQRGVSTREEIYARGLMYAPGLMGPHQGAPDDAYWRIWTKGWGYCSTGRLADQTPTLTAMRNISQAHTSARMLTTGTTCSPSALLLNFFMQNIYANQGGTSGSTTGGLAMETSLLRSRYQELTLSDLLGREVAQRAQLRTEMLEGREGAEDGSGSLTGILGIYQTLSWHQMHNPEPFWYLCRRGHRAAFRGRGRTLSATLDRAWGMFRRANEKRNPGHMLATINRWLNEEGLPEATYQALSQMHEFVYRGCAEVGRAIRRLISDPAWGQIPESPPANLLEGWPEAAAHPAPASGRCTDTHGITPERHDQLRSDLRTLRDQLQQAEAQDTGDWTERDVSNVLKDITVVGQLAHEKSIVKVFPFDRIMEVNALPLSGRMAAYDPLSGVEFFPDRGLAESGQLYYFEAGGSLQRWDRADKRIQIAGAQPFHWVPITGNRMHFKSAGGRLMYLTMDRNRIPKIRDLNTCRPLVLRNVYPGYVPEDEAVEQREDDRQREAQEARQRGSTTPTSASVQAPPGHFRPIVIHGLRGSGGSWAEAGPCVPWQETVADRAVPFPTMDEAAGKFVPTGDASERMTDICGQLTSEFTGVDRAVVHRKLTEIRLSPILVATEHLGHNPDAFLSFQNRARQARAISADLTTGGRLGHPGGELRVEYRDPNVFFNLRAALLRSGNGARWFGSAQSGALATKLNEVGLALRVLAACSRTSRAGPSFKDSICGRGS